jgi:uncharacterized protein
MDFGLSDKALKKLLCVFHRYPEIERVQLFGSRAMGNYKPHSDIDLVLFGNIEDVLLARIYAELDELPLPYKFDVKVYSDITYLPLKEHIDNFSKLIYLRNNNLDTV